MTYDEKSLNLNEVLTNGSLNSIQDQKVIADVDVGPEYIKCSNYYIFDDDEASYEQLLQSCSPFEKSLLEEVAGGDYWLARSILHDLNKD